MKRIVLLAWLLALSSFAYAADVPISGLPAATSITGTDVVPIVQSSTTKKATFSLIENKPLSTPSISAGVLTLAYSTSNWFDVSSTANITSIVVTGLPVSGNVARFVVCYIANGIGYTYVSPFGTTRYDGGAAFTRTTTNLHRTCLGYETSDAGTTGNVFSLGLDMY